MKGRDAITASLIRSSLQAAIEEMSIALVRTARSPVMREAMDFATGFADSSGRVITQGLTMLLHLAGVQEAIDSVIARGGQLEDGDVFAFNDPYDGGSHLPDVFVVAPVFFEAKLLGFVANVAHHSDMGGSSPGGNSASATTIYEEGLRIPVLRVVAGGKRNDALFKLIVNNVRTPEEVMGDLDAQLASINVGRKRIRALCAEWGRDAVEASWDLMLAQARAGAQELARRLPDGVYRYTDYLDDDGRGNRNLPICVAIEVAGTRISVDLSGSSRQVEGAINATASWTKSAVYLALATLADETMPRNFGFFENIEVRIPHDSILNVAPPGACGARAVTGYRVIDAMFGALAQAVPDEIFAASDGGNTLVTIAGEDVGVPYILVDPIVGAWGARPSKDGLQGNTMIGINVQNQPVEALEARHPIRIEQYSYRRDSGGIGEFRGGNGMIRSYRILSPKATIFVRADRSMVAPYGLSGGGPGAGSRTELIRANGEVVALPAKCRVDVEQGDLLVHYSPGGGGFGDPSRRSPEAIERDLALGYISSAVSTGLGAARGC